MFFYLKGHDYVTHELLKKKVVAEIELYPNGIGEYKLYSFLMQILNDERQVRKFMLAEGYTRTETTNVKSRYDYYNRNKASCQVQTF